MACLTIDCQTCSMRGTDACSDCVVTFLCEPGQRGLCEPDQRGPVVLEDDEYAAFRMLGGGGLVPPIRHRGTGNGRRLALVSPS